MSYDTVEVLQVNQSPEARNEIVETMEAEDYADKCSESFWYLVHDV